MCCGWKPSALPSAGEASRYPARWLPSAGCVCNDLGFVMQVPSAQGLVRAGLGPSRNVTHLLPALRGAGVARRARLQRVAQPKGLLPGEGISFAWKRDRLWMPWEPGLRLTMASLVPTASLCWPSSGQRRGLSGSGCWRRGGRERGAVETHLSSRFTPCKGHGSSLAFVADL